MSRLASLSNASLEAETLAIAPASPALAIGKKRVVVEPKVKNVGIPVGKSISPNASWRENPMRLKPSGSEKIERKSKTLSPLEMDVEGKPTSSCFKKAKVWVPAAFILFAFTVLVLLGPHSLNVIFPFSCDGDGDAETPTVASSWLRGTTYFGLISVAFYAVCIETVPELQKSKTLKMKLYFACLACPLLLMTLRIGINDTKPKDVTCLPSSPMVDTGACWRIQNTNGGR